MRFVGNRQEPEEYAVKPRSMEDLIFFEPTPLLTEFHEWLMEQTRRAFIHEFSTSLAIPNTALARSDGVQNKKEM